MTTQGWVHVARQPIYDRELKLHGYELAFRDSAAARTDTVGDLATTKVIVSTFTEFGVETLVGDRLAFVTLTRPFLTGELPLPLPAGTTVLEVLDDVALDDAVVSGIAGLRGQGYTIALDHRAGSPSDDVLALLGYVKVDVSGGPAGDLLETVERARAAGVRTVARRVERPEDMELCTQLGIDYLQGQLLARPDVVSGAGLSPSQVTCMQLVSRIAEPSLDFDDLESLVKTDVALTYRMLKAANSASSGLRNKVTSVRSALVMVGLRQLRAWLLLMLVGDVTSASEAELSAAMTRARTCELLAPLAPGVERDAAFIVGMLSSLGDLLGRPLDQLTDSLPLAPELHDAIVLRHGPLGRLLDAVVAYDTGDLARVEGSGLDTFEMSRAYLSAVGWSLQTCESVLRSE